MSQSFYIIPSSSTGLDVWLDVEMVPLKDPFAVSETQVRLIDSTGAFIVLGVRVNSTLFARDLSSADEYLGCRSCTENLMHGIIHEFLHINQSIIPPGWSLADEANDNMLTPDTHKMHEIFDRLVTRLTDIYYDQYMKYRQQQLPCLGN